MKTKPEKLTSVLVNLMAFLGGQGTATKKEFIRNLDRMLDTLNDMDFFGTEGQCDPRGDRRNAR